MRKRIFFNILLLTIISILVVSTTICAIFYMQISSSVKDELRERASLLKETLTTENFSSLSISDMRLTIIDTDGVVLHDDDQNPSSLPNHLDREEVKAAIETGTGESRRFSDTLGKETYYYAVKLDNGMILRLAKTTDSIWGMFGSSLPIIGLVVLGIILIAYFFAVRLTKRIVDPINKVDLEGKLSAPYDELAPFIQTISKQRERIGMQMEDIQNRSDTITAIMDSMSEGVILIDMKGSILSVNKTATEIFNISFNPEGKNILEILRDTELNECMRLALSGKRNELNMMHDDRSYRVYFSPVTDSGAIILFMDITERTVAEKLRREFSANVSHELKTPLTTIYGNVEMLKDGMVKEEDKDEFYEKIKDEAARLITLIEDIIMLSQLDEENIAIKYESVNLVTAAKAAIESLSQKALDLKIDIDLSGKGTINANYSQITEMFYNLIENAIKYNKPGGAVSIEIESDKDAIKIIVSDTGIGIPQKDHDRVFERFYRVDKSRSKKTGGTGLGLAIVKHIIMANGGTITLESEEGIGTKISINLYSENKSK